MAQSRVLPQWLLVAGLMLSQPAKVLEACTMAAHWHMCTHASDPDATKTIILPFVLCTTIHWWKLRGAHVTASKQWLQSSPGSADGTAPHPQSAMLPTVSSLFDVAIQLRASHVPAMARTRAIQHKAAITTAGKQLQGASKIDWMIGGSYLGNPISSQEDVL